MIVKIIKPISILVIDDSGDKYEGTPEQVVHQMRRWDTSMGRVTNNAEYMRLVASRLIDFPICRKEMQFLRTLESFGLVTVNDTKNKKGN
tara:strand:- start:263 stop:532 length:270 start_codon:yes stop_codon:yes gene_type:complete